MSINGEDWEISMHGFGSALRDLSDAARRGELAICRNRREECLRVAQSFAWMYRKSLLIVGGQGSGKTTFLHGVAKVCVDTENLDNIEASQLLELDAKALKTRTVRIKEVTTAFLKSARKDPKLILVIDDIARIFEDIFTPDDPASLLVNAILKREICCVGTITPRELEELTQQEPRVGHVFKSIRLRSFSAEETLALLEDMRPALERDAELRINDRALQKAVSLSQEYLPDMEQPGKSINALRRAIARCELRIRAAKEEGLCELDSSMNPLLNEVSSHDVKMALSAWTGVDIAAAETKKWEAKLSERLKRRVFGQDAAVEQVVSVLARIRERFSMPGCPAGVAVFGGPPGVGKGCLAHSVALTIAGRSGCVIEANLREYVGPDSLQRLRAKIDGDGVSNQGEKAASALRIVLLRDMEQADPLVLGPLLRMATQDCIQRQGCKCASFQKCFFVFTLNSPMSSSNPASGSLWLADSLSSRIRKDLVEKFDAIVPFEPLGIAAQCSVIRVVMSKLLTKSSARNVRLGMTEDAYRYIAREGYAPESGIHGVLSVLNRKVIQPVMEALESESMADGGMIDIYGGANISLRMKAYGKADVLE
jgi:ATP-dependent Clp protease ATP-binding subunit ClpA